MKSKVQVVVATSILTLLVVLCTLARGAPAQAARAFIPYADARPIFDAVRADLLPPDLRDLAPAEREARWPAWIVRHDAAIRAVQPATVLADTSIFIDFGIEQALDTMKAAGALRAGSVRRVAIVGPGLDSTGKLDGRDFYPEQTIRPFAVTDSLLRLELAEPDRLEVVALDISAPVLQHLEGARARARAGTPYTVVLPRNTGLPWSPELVDYWGRLGNWIGEATRAPAVSPNAGPLDVRAIAVRPPVVVSVTPVDLNIVTERLAVQAAPFDLIVATNILLSYDVVDQSLAVANIADMLRAGGFLLIDNRIVELPGSPLTGAGQADVGYMTQAGTGQTGDRFTWYRRGR